MDYVVVGNGIACVGCVEGVRSIDKKGKITVISQEPYHTYCRPLISYVLAGKVPQSSLPYRDERFFKEMGVDVVLGEKVVELEDGKVKTDSGRTVGFDRLLVATGSSPKSLGIKGEEKEGVFYFRNIEDMKRVLSYLPKIKEVVVVGAGMVGMKLTDAFLSKRKKVHLVISSKKVMSMVLSEKASKRVEKTLRDKGVEIYFGEDVVEILGREEVSGVLLKSGRKVNCQAVFIAKGVSPNLGPFSHLKGERGISTDRRLMTSQEGIYAAGDVAEAFDPLYGKNRLNALWFNAYFEGLVAGFNMAGGHREYPGGIASNSIQVGKLPIATMGISNVDEGYEILTYDNGKSFRQVNLKDGKIVGAIFIGDVSYSGLFKGLILKGVDVGGIKDDLLTFGKEFVELVKEIYRYQFHFEVEWRTAVLPERVMKPYYYTPGDYGRL